MKFNLPWCGNSKYWLCFKSNDSKLLGRMIKKLQIRDFVSIDQFLAFNVSSWVKTWEKIYEDIRPAEEDITAVVVADNGEEIDFDEILPSFENVKIINTIAENYWLGEAFMEDKFVCFLQEIQDRSGQVYGYESFVRATGKDGNLAGGWEIIQAAYDLKIHHILDKYLQSLAIKQFAESKLPGTLFINFIAGFIQLPERYLEALNAAVEESDFIPKKVVLDVPIPELKEEYDQLAHLIDFCGTRGYSVALDDIKTDSDMDKVMSDSSPDFVKIDRGLTSNYTNTSVSDRIKSIIVKAHKHGCMVVAEGIEDKQTFDALHLLGADLFQGYHFAKPKSIEELKKQSKKAGKKTTKKKVAKKVAKKAS